MVKKYEDKSALNEMTSVGKLSDKDVKDWYDFMIDFYQDLDAVQMHSSFIAKTFEEAKKESTALADATRLMMVSVSRLATALKNEMSLRNNATKG